MSDDVPASPAARPRLFATREARRLGVLFAIVYFAQGMVYLPDQVVAIVFKELSLIHI